MPDEECKRQGFPDGHGGPWRNSVYSVECDEEDDDDKEPEGKTIEVEWVMEERLREMQDLSASPGDTILFTWEGEQTVTLMKNCSAKKQKWNNFRCPKEGEEVKRMGDSSPAGV